MSRVLLTGANGDIGRSLVDHLRARHDLRAAVFDLERPDAAPPLEGEGVFRLDIRDAAAVREAMKGVDAVVHLAGERAVSASFEALVGPNIVGVQNVFEAAGEAGVRKLVFASSNHATGGYDKAELWPLDATQPVWPDSLYGVTKVFGEALGRFVADRYAMSVICLRIGWFLPRPTRAALRMWLSPADARRLVDCCLQAQVGYGIYYGVSANTRCTWDMTAAHEELGYFPEDDSERFVGEMGTTGETI